MITYSSTILLKLKKYKIERVRNFSSVREPLIQEENSGTLI